MSNISFLIIFEGFKVITDKQFCDIPTGFLRCRKSFCVTIAILLRHFPTMTFIFRGGRSTLDVWCCMFCESLCEVCIKWWQRANHAAGVGHRERTLLRGRGSSWCRSVVCGLSFWLGPAAFRTLCTFHFALYTPHSTLYTLHSTLRTLYLPHCHILPLPTLHFTLCTLKLYTSHSAFHTLRFTLDSPHATLYTFCTPHFTFDTSHTLHCTLHTLHFTLLFTL